MWRRNCINESKSFKHSTTKIFVMKTIVRLTPVLLAAVFFVSCSKKNDVVVPQNPIVGSWILNNADESDGSSWQPFYTGLENGIFYLYNNGTAEYDDGNTIMQGTWY